MPVEHFEDPELHRRTLEYLGDAITADIDDKRRHVERAIRRIDRGIKN
jgi:hypothetical protein